ncbi:hypothetical protein [Verrucomicrobium sp. BvORR034]|uniref:hypothetical protein n=1 Tax=Verrucomicrobium sp. BvORR034 TaxID=1396418 RepID=UPI000679D97D|nr:hypothetical protein [Verrucomicrobium sp. BvORR034]
MQLRFAIEGVNPVGDSFNLRVTNEANGEVAMMAGWKGEVRFSHEEEWRTASGTVEYGRKLWDALWRAQGHLDENAWTVTLGEHFLRSAGAVETLRINVVSEQAQSIQHPVWESLGLTPMDRDLDLTAVLDPRALTPFVTVVRRVGLTGGLSTPSVPSSFARRLLFATGNLTEEQREIADKAFAAFPNGELPKRRLQGISDFKEIFNVMADPSGLAFDTLVLLAHGVNVDIDDDAGTRSQLNVMLGTGASCKLVSLNKLLGALGEVTPNNRPSLVFLLVCDAANGAMFDANDLVPRQVVAQLGIPYVFAAHSSINIEEGLKVVSATLNFLRDRHAGAREQQRAADPIASHFHAGAEYSRSCGMISCLTYRPPAPIVPTVDIGAELSERRVAFVLKALPVLGPGMNSQLLGDIRSTANRLADRYKFPLSGAIRGDLNLVSSFVFEAARQSHSEAGTPIDALTTSLALNSAVSKVQEVDFNQLENGQHCGVYFNLSRLPFPLFLTANRDHFLSCALIKRGRHPVIASLPDHSQRAAETVLEYINRSDPLTPVVLHIFGHAEVEAGMSPGTVAEARGPGSTSKCTVVSPRVNNFTMSSLLADLMKFDNGSVDLQGKLFETLANRHCLLMGFSPASIETWLTLAKLAEIVRHMPSHVSEGERDAGLHFFLDPDDSGIETDHRKSSGREGLIAWLSSAESLPRSLVKPTPQVNFTSNCGSLFVETARAMEGLPGKRRLLFDNVLQI